MTNNLLRAGALSCALLTSTAMCTQPARAQEPNLSPPPENFVVTPGGVDMRSGRYAYSQTDVSIGGDGGLALTRTMAQSGLGHANPFGNFSHNWDIMLNEKRISVENNVFEHSPGSPGFQIEISFGGTQETFRARAETWGYEHTSRSSYAALDVTGTKSSASAVYTLRMSDGTEAVFRPMGSNDCSSLVRCAYVSRITQADGTRLDFEYDNAGGNATRLLSVTSNRGYALLLEYSGSLVTKACTLNLAVTTKPGNNLCPGNAPGVATYTYESVGGNSRLASATDASGGAWGFVNTTTSQGFVRPGESTPWLTNTIQTLTDPYGFPEQIVTSQSFADGTGYSYSLASPPGNPGQGNSVVGGFYTDNLSNVTTVRYDFPTEPCDPHPTNGTCPPDRPIDENWSGPPYQTTPGPVEVIDALGRTTTTDYCDPAALAGLPSNWPHRCYVQPFPVSRTSPGGIKTFMTWDGAGNLTQTRQVAVAGSGLPDIVQSATYNCIPGNFRFCKKPISTTDARGAVTDYDYDGAHGGLTRQRLPAATSGAPRPETRHEYAQRYAWVSNGSGGYVRAAAPVWVRTATSMCRTSAATGNPSAPCATSGDEVRTTYDYGSDSGPNNLNLRGTAVTADGATLRTCITYDANGRPIAETGPGAQLTQCQ